MRPSKIIFLIGFFAFLVGAGLCYMDITDSYIQFFLPLKPLHSFFLPLMLFGGFLSMIQILRVLTGIDWVENDKQHDYLEALAKGKVKNRREWRRLQRKR